MSTFNIEPGEIVTEGIILDEFRESLEVEGQLVTEIEPAVTTQNTLNQIEVESEGKIQADSTAIQVDGIATIIENEGLIDGSFNGINLANSDIASAQITNEGIITSGSRAVNIGGVGGVLINEDEGLITTRADPRNGTVYGDVTAQNILIENLDDGVIDVGEGLNGDAISLELGAEVNGSVINQGLVQGRGLPGVANPDNQASAVRLYWVPTSGGDVSIFNGNIENSGTFAAENGPAVIIEENVEFNGSIINSGLIEGGDTENGQLAIDLSGVVNAVEVINSGEIEGNVIGSENSDLFDSTGGEVDGVVLGGAGDDTLIGGDEDDMLHGGAGDDLLNGGLGDNNLVGGAGADQFVLAIGGTNIIGDFEVGIDRFLLDDLTFEQLELTQERVQLKSVYLIPTTYWQRL